MKATTKLIHSIPVDEQTGAIAVPIYQTSTFQQEAPGINKGFDYSRSNNPTRAILENIVADLESGAVGLAFASGLAAIDNVIKLLQYGDEVIAVDDIYGGAFRLFDKVYAQYGIKVTYVNTADITAIEKHIRPATKLIWLETPTNPTLKISDIKAIATLAKAHQILLAVDNTFATPIGQKPLELGADIVVHSATKYLGGHSDIIAGVVVARDPALGAKLKFFQNATGNILGPFDSFLLIRGIETLPLRFREHSRNALAIAEYLSQHPQVEKVFYPGLTSHENHSLAKEQQHAFGGIVSFVIKSDSITAANSFVTNTKLFKLAESLGGIKSLLCHPAQMTHKSIPDATRRAAGVQDGLIRLSVGLEDVEDLIDDLDSAFLLVQVETEAAPHSNEVDSITSTNHHAQQFVKTTTVC